MKIGKNSAVRFDYTLKGDDGKVIDTSEGQEPLEYLHGHGQIVVGLEREMEGKTEGDRLSVKVAAHDGYGERVKEKTMNLPKAELPAGIEAEVGMQLTAEDQSGQPIPLWVTEVNDTHVVLDGNHPLAGQTLHFAVEIRGVRAATQEELTHGHVHGAHGHHH